MIYTSANRDEAVFDDPQALRHPPQPEPAPVVRHRRALLPRACTWPGSRAGCSSRSCSTAFPTIELIGEPRRQRSNLNNALKALPVRLAVLAIPDEASESRLASPPCIPSTSTRSTRRRSSMDHVVSSDRNAYDRYYFNAHDRTGEVFLVSGFGVYPNLGRDRRLRHRAGRRPPGHRAHVRRHRRGRRRRSAAPAVGAYRIEVIEPLQVVRIVCDTARPRPRGRHHLDRLVPGRRGAGPRHASRAARSSSTPAASPRWAPGPAPSRLDDHDVGRHRRRVGRHPRPVVGHPPGGRARAGRPGRGRGRSRTTASGGCTCRSASTTTPSC